MNSVALPASASTTTLSAEADLVRQAARGDAEAFGELYRRHSAPAWRLAQAVGTDRDAAASAFRDGFVRAVRTGRFARRAAGAFRPHVLSSVYRAAIDLASDRTAAPAPVRRTVAGGPEAALADAAFRSLPERWRAAVWLSEVESLPSDRIAAILGVSASVADQLVARGRRGLAGRFAQAHHEAPDHIGDVLRPLAVAAPADLAEATTARWSAGGADHLSVVAPVAGWLEDRGARPMSVAVGALIGLGLIGLGVVSTSSTIRSLSEAAGSASSSGAVPVHTCLGLACPSGNGTTAVGAGLLSASFPNGSSPFGSSGSGGSGGAFGSTFFAGGGGGPGGTFGISGTTGTTGTTGTSGTSGTSGTTGTGSTGTTVPPSGTGGTTYTVPGVGTLTTSSSGTSTNLLGGTATGSAGTGGVSTSLGGTTIVSTSTTTTAPSTTTTTTPVQGVTNTLSTTVTTIAGTLSGTTSTLTTIGGL